MIAGARASFGALIGGLFAALAFAAGSALAAPAAIEVQGDDGQRVALAAPAARIVTLSPALAELVCALDACARIVGTDRNANWPPELLARPKLGGLEDAQIERIAALKPDLVLAAQSTRANERLRALGVPVLALEPRELGAYVRSADVVARALGLPAAGARLAAALDARLAAAAARVPAALRGATVYLEVASTPHAAGSASFVGEVLARLGLVNIVPSTLGPFPQLSPEYVLRRDPAIVIAPARALEQMPRRPGWARLRAFTQGRRCGLAPTEWDALVRTGPRLADAADAIVRCLQEPGAHAAGSDRPATPSESR